MNIYAALEIGTTRTVLAIGEAAVGDKLKVTCHAEIPSTGVRKSQILDINQATQSIRSVLREIEKKQLAVGNSITIGNAFLVVSGQHVKADSFTGTAQIARGKVTAEDMNEVGHNTRAMVLYPSLLVGEPWLYLVFEVVVMNILFFYMRSRHEQLCQRLQQQNYPQA